MSNHGNAAWANEKALSAAGMYEPHGGIYLGHDGANTGKPLFYHEDGHILTVAPPGSGKTVSVVIPNLLTHDCSMVVTDPKGALAAQTAKRRRDMGQKIVILNPWRDEMKQSLGVDLGDTGFNPLSILKRGNPNIVDDAEKIAGMLCPTPPKINDPSWTQRAASIIKACLLYLAHKDGETLTLGRLFELVRQTPDGWRALAGDMLEIENFDMVAYAGEILSPLASEKQFAGIEQAMHNATKMYDPNKLLAQHVAKNGFNPDDLKRERVTVYIVIPPSRRRDNMSWLGLVMSLCAEAVGKPGKSAPVTLLAEEFANLGYMPTIAQAMAEYREAGLRVHLIVQNLHQLERIYGRDGMHEITNLCAVRQFFGVDDLNTAKIIEQMLGTFTAQTISESLKPETFGRPQSVNHGEMGVPLKRAQDILNMPKHWQMIFVRGAVPPIKAHVRPFYTEQIMLNISEPNPYRSEPQERVAAEWPHKAPQERQTIDIELNNNMIHAIIWGLALVIGCFVTIWAVFGFETLNTILMWTASTVLCLGIVALFNTYRTKQDF